MKKNIATPPVKKGGIYSLDVVSLGHSGEGVGRVEDFTVFVPQALPGEKVKAKIIEVKKNYAKGVLLTVETASPRRTTAKCPIYKSCGGCQLQHLTYEGQLESKRQTVVDAITRIGKLDGVPVHATLGCTKPWYYRNKMQFPVGLADGAVVAGCFAQGTHTIIPTTECTIQHQANNVILQEVQAALHEFGISVYDENTGTGLVRHVLGRVGVATGEVMVVLVTAAKHLPHKEQIIDRLKNRIPGLVSVIQNVNGRKTNVIMGEETQTLWGRDTITDRLGDCSFAISARSFFQVNTTQAAVLYEKALEYADLSGQEVVIDAYCGTGTISLFLAQKAKKVYGIEIVEPAIRDARLNAERNQVENAEFIVGDAVDVLPRLFKEGLRPDVIVVDPPRAGCDRQVLETFVNMKPQRIVYVSCNPSSLARDLAVLNEQGYETQEVQPVDMFPQTFHVEAIVSIQRRATGNP